MEEEEEGEKGNEGRKRNEGNEEEREGERVRRGLKRDGRVMRGNIEKRKLGDKREGRKKNPPHRVTKHHVRVNLLPDNVGRS